MLRFKITIQALNLRHKRLHRSSKPNNRPVPECLTLGALLTPLVLPSATLKLVTNKFYNLICSLVLGVYTRMWVSRSTQNTKPYLCNVQEMGQQSRT